MGGRRFNTRAVRQQTLEYLTLGGSQRALEIGEVHEVGLQGGDARLERLQSRQEFGNPEGGKRRGSASGQAGNLQHRSL